MSGDSDKTMEPSVLIEQAIQELIFPFLKIPIKQTPFLKSVQGNVQKMEVHLSLGFPAGELITTLTTMITEAIHALYPDCVVKVEVTTRIYAHVVQSSLKPVPGIKNIIAVSSAKGGVGKSTTALNLAVALQALGAKVGLLDADIYGPNQPHMLGKMVRPDADENNKILPVMQYGLQTMSMGYLIDAQTPAVWRGPMVAKALQQLLFETKWDALDYLIIDLPPGTGDIQLTLAQKVPVAGAIVITTPQAVACLDAAKGIAMFEKVSIAVLGVIENMSHHVCRACGEVDAIFGEGGGAALAQSFDVPLLGSIPLQKDIREQADKGEPIVHAAPDSAIARIYREMAWAVGAKLSLQAKDYQGRFPSIVLE
jgi:ATP-binding protein involved in chromosome partitioning